MGWAACLGESMFQLPRVGWRLLACQNGASPDCISVVVVVVAAAAASFVVVVVVVVVVVRSHMRVCGCAHHLRCASYKLIKKACSPGDVGLHDSQGNYSTPILSCAKTVLP